MNAVVYKGAFDCMIKTIKKEGFLGLYKGITPPLLGAMPSSALYFGSFGFAQQIQQPKLSNGDFSLMQTFYSGSFAGACCLGIVVPIERAKCLLQIQSTAERRIYTGLFDCLRKIYKREGFQSLYKGFTLTFIRDVPGSGLHYAVYEYIKNTLTDLEKSRNSTSSRTVNVGVLKPVLSGGLSGIVFWIVLIPVDTLKSNYQISSSNNVSMMDVYKNITKIGGISSLYKGLYAVLLRAFPANAALFTGYEFATNFLVKMESS